jgi:uncharacterized iron-regulated membrane protein
MATSRVRSTLLWLHRWVGLTVGLVFALIAVSGSALLFQPQFFRWAHGDLIPPGLSQQVGSIDQWVDQSRVAVPGLVGPIAIWLPHVDHNVSDAGMVVYGGRPPGGLGQMGIVGVLVAPATGHVLGVVDIDRSPAYAPIFLHRDLWMGATGRAISGVLTIGIIFLLVAGLYLWWPPLKRLGRKLSIRPWRKTLTYATPLHEWLGIWSLVVLLVLAVTGLALVQPTWVGPALDTIVGPPAPEPAFGPCGTPIGFQAAIDKAHALVPAGTLREMVPLDEQFRHWQIAFAAPGRPSPLDDTHVHADLTCGTVALESTAASRSRRHAADLWIASLHDGAAFGLAGEVAVSLAGLIPFVLAWSGVRMWWRGRRARIKVRVPERAAAVRRVVRPSRSFTEENADDVRPFVSP